MQGRRGDSEPRTRKARKAHEARAPRLAAHERLAPYITRRGRFKARDPLVTHRPPGTFKVLGAVGWAGLVFYVFWRAFGEQRVEEVHEGA